MKTVIKWKHEEEVGELEVDITDHAAQRFSSRSKVKFPMEDSKAIIAGLCQDTRRKSRRSGLFISRGWMIVVENDRVITICRHKPKSP